MAGKKELKALITLAGKVDPSLQNALLKASAQASKTSSKLSKIGSFASKSFKAIGKATLEVGKAVAAGIGAGLTALGGLAMNAAKSADELLTLKDKTGISAEELQRLQYIAGQLGANFDAFPQAISIMTKYMDSARKGSKEAAAAFQALGIQITDSTGKLRPQSQVFQEAIVQLSKIESEADRNALAFKIFGRGAADLFPLLNAGTDEIQRLAAEADNLGLVLTEDTLVGLDEMGDTIDKIKSSAKGFGFKLISTLLPKVQPVLDMLVDKLPVISSLLSGIGGEFLGGIADMLPDILDLAGELMPVLIPVLKMISKSLGPTIVNLLKQALPMVAQIVETALPLFIQAFNMLMSILQPMLPMLFQIVQQILPVLAQLVMIIFQIISPFIPVLLSLVEALLPPIMEILQALMPYLEALTPILSVVADIIGGILVDAIKIVSPLLEGLAKIIGTVVKGIASVIGGIADFLGLSGNAEVQASVTTAEYAGTGGKFAEGGFANRPSIFGEDGLEVAIPIKRTPRSLSLLNQTAKMLGASPTGTSVQVVYNPVIYGGNAAEIEPILQKHKEEIRMMIEDIFESKVRVAYGY